MSNSAAFSANRARCQARAGVRIFGFTNLYGCEIGDDVKIGTFVEIQKGARIGNRCKISSHTFICEGVALEDEVFIGHNVTFINDLYPSLDQWRGTTPNRSRLEVRSHLVRKRRFHRFGSDVALRHNRRGAGGHRRGQRGDHATSRPTPLWQATRPECCAWPILTPSE